MPFCIDWNWKRTADQGMKSYVRDKRSPISTSAIVSKVMRANKAKNTGPEIMFRKLLTENGIRGYRLHWKLPGRPDVVFVKKKLAIFINGCYFICVIILKIFDE